MTGRREVVVAFDTPSDRRRRRFTRLVSRYGVRVQRSVFLLSGSAAELRGVWAELERVMDPAVDLLLMTAVVPGAWWQAGAVRALDVPLVAAF